MSVVHPFWRKFRGIFSQVYHELVAVLNLNASDADDRRLFDLFSKVTELAIASTALTKIDLENNWVYLFYFI